MKVVLLHNCADSNHFGSKLVTEGFYHLCAQRDMEVIGTQYKKDPLDRGMCDKADLVIVNGEGSLHHGNYSELLDVAKDYRSILVNTVWQENPVTTRLRDFELVSVRESSSYNSMYTQRIPEIVPDVIFAAPMGKQPDSKNGTFFSDSSAFRKVFRSAHVRGNDFVSSLLGSRRACLGRFHAICLAARFHIPFSAYVGNTHKNTGLMRDMMALDRLYEDQPSARASIPDTVEPTVTRYAETAPRRIAAFWDKVAEL